MGDCETIKTLLQPDPAQTLREASITLEKLVATAAKTVMLQLSNTASIWVSM